MARPISDQARAVQAECLKAKGYPDDAAAVLRGDVDFDATALEMLDHNDGSGLMKTNGHM